MMIKKMVLFYEQHEELVDMVVSVLFSVFIAVCCTVIPYLVALEVCQKCCSAF